MKVEIKHSPKGALGEFSFTSDDSKLTELVNKHLASYVTVANPFIEGDIDSILSAAYKITNSEDTAWYENVEAYPTSSASKGCRSTSIGDLIIVDDTTYIVSNYGFIKLELEFDKAKIEKKIEKLLSLATSPNKNEAEAAMKKAMELMAKYNILESDLNGKSEIVEDTFVSGFTKIPPWVALLYAGIAKSMGAYALRQNGDSYRNQKAKMIFIGRKSDVIRAKYLLVFSYRAINKQAESYKAEHKYLSKQGRINYKQGLVSGFIASLKKEYAKAEEAEYMSHSKALVPVDTRVGEAEAYAKKNHDITSVTVTTYQDGHYTNGVKDSKNIQPKQGVSKNSQNSLK